jgi:uncharacterized protein (DUF427 family)
VEGVALARVVERHLPPLASLGMSKHAQQTTRMIKICIHAYVIATTKHKFTYVETKTAANIMIGFTVSAPLLKVIPSRQSE